MIAKTSVNHNHTEPVGMRGNPRYALNFDDNFLWFVLFATYGKAAKICSLLEAAKIEHFYPVRYRARRIRGSERTRQTLEPVLSNFVFVKSSKEYLDRFLKGVKLQLKIKSGLFYRDLGSKEIMIVPETQMQNFIAIAGCSNKERIIYLSNREVDFDKGTRVQITGGAFEGVEGIFMRIKGDRRVVVTLTNLFSVATAFVPIEYIVPIEK